jgi:protease II
MHAHTRTRQDCLTTMLDDTIPLTTIEWEE